MKAVIKLKCSAPSKVILSGEHSVVHGAPALSFTINQNSVLEMQSTPAKAEAAQVSINLIDLAEQTTLGWQEFEEDTQQLAKRFKEFQQGKISIDKVCLSPLDLPLATLYEFSQIHPLAPQNLTLSYTSDIWQNRGLGSSAALITSLVTTLAKLTHSQTALLKIAQKAESYQHGKSSGLDPATLLQGGWLKYQEGKLTPLPVELSFNNYKLWLIDTGKAKSSTGETVAHTSEVFAKNPNLLEEFISTTQQLEKALLENNLDSLLNNLEQNQRLLEELRIVPKKVQKFIQEAKQVGIAKQCGAGSLHGDAGGVVLLISKTEPKGICNKFNYNYELISPTQKGVSCEMVS